MHAGGGSRRRAAALQRPELGPCTPGPLGGRRPSTAWEGLRGDGALWPRDGQKAAGTVLDGDPGTGRLGVTPSAAPGYGRLSGSYGHLSRRPGNTSRAGASARLRTAHSGDGAPGQPCGRRVSPPARRAARPARPGSAPAAGGEAPPPPGLGAGRSGRPPGPAAPEGSAAPQPAPDGGKSFTRRRRRSRSACHATEAAGARVLGAARPGPVPHGLPCPGSRSRGSTG